MNPYMAFVVSWTVLAAVSLASGYLIHESNKIPPYPADYSVAVERVLKYVDVVAEDPARKDSEVVTTLTQQGVSPVDAQLLMQFVPTAFTWVSLRKYGFSDFPTTYAVINRVVPRVFDWPLSSEQYFVAAQNIANDITTGGHTARLSPETFEAIVGRSEDPS